jgi:hypothetical protein
MPACVHQCKIADLPGHFTDGQLPPPRPQSHRGHGGIAPTLPRPRQSFTRQFADICPPLAHNHSIMSFSARNRRALRKTPLTPSPSGFCGELQQNHEFTAQPTSHIIENKELPYRIPGGGHMNQEIRPGTRDGPPFPGLPITCKSPAGQSVELRLLGNAVEDALRTQEAEVCFLIKWEIPRLCRGGSRSLTFTGVHPRNSER